MLDKFIKLISVLLLLIPQGLFAGGAEPAQAIFANEVTQIPWWGYLMLSFLPFVIGTALAISITIYWKRINRGMGEEPYSIKKQYRFAILCGFATGAFCQWGLQELGEMLVNIPALTIKAILVTGIFTGFFAPMAYDILRAVSKRKGWDVFYDLISVKHKRGKDYTDPYHNGDITRTRYKKPEDDNTDLK